MRMGAYTDEMAAVNGYGYTYARSPVTGRTPGLWFICRSADVRASSSYEVWHNNCVLTLDMRALGIAILAYQYPMMLMVTYMNEVRKGNVLNLDNDEDMKKLLAQSLSYSSVIGMYGDAVALVAGSSTRSGVAAFGPTDALGTMTSALGDLAKGDVQQGAGGALKALNQASILGVVPGSQALVKALQEDG